MLIYLQSSFYNWFAFAILCCLWLVLWLIKLNYTVIEDEDLKDYL